MNIVDDCSTRQVQGRVSKPRLSFHFKDSFLQFIPALISRAASFIVFRTKNKDRAVIFNMIESMPFRVHVDGGSILKTIFVIF